MSAGFYKYEPPILLYGRRVLDAHYTLSIETKDDHEYPVDGWYWFDSDTEAHAFFGYVPEPEEPSDTDVPEPEEPSEPEV